MAMSGTSPPQASARARGLPPHPLMSLHECGVAPCGGSGSGSGSSNAIPGGFSQHQSPFGVTTPVSATLPGAYRNSIVSSCTSISAFSDACSDTNSYVSVDSGNSTMVDVLVENSNQNRTVTTTVTATTHSPGGLNSITTPTEEGHQGRPIRIRRPSLLNVSHAAQSSVTPPQTTSSPQLPLPNQYTTGYNATAVSSNSMTNRPALPLQPPGAEPHALPLEVLPPELVTIIQDGEQLYISECTAAGDPVVPRNNGSNTFPPAASTGLHSTPPLPYPSVVPSHAHSSLPHRSSLGFTAVNNSYLRGSGGSSGIPGVAGHRISTCDSRCTTVSGLPSSIDSSDSSALYTSCESGTDPSFICSTPTHRSSSPSKSELPISEASREEISPKSKRERKARKPSEGNLYPPLVVVVDTNLELERRTSTAGSEGFAPDIPSCMVQIINDGELEYVEKEYIRDR